jgi:periplasmic divalent cation tolerance protein
MKRCKQAASSGMAEDSQVQNSQVQNLDPYHDQDHHPHRDQYGDQYSDQYDTQYGVVLVTASSQSEAENIAEVLIADRLAACVSLMPIRSIYTWKGAVCREEEWQLMIKTHLSHFPQLEAKIRQIHSYETPEVIALPIIAGSQPYLAWLNHQLQSPSNSPD